MGKLIDGNNPLKSRKNAGRDVLRSVDTGHLSDKLDELSALLGCKDGEELMATFAYLRATMAATVLNTETRITWNKDGVVAPATNFDIVDSAEHYFNVSAGLGGYLDTLSISVDGGAMDGVACEVLISGIDPDGDLVTATFYGSQSFDLGILLTSGFVVKVTIPTAAAAPGNVKVILSGTARPRRSSALVAGELARGASGKGGRHLGLVAAKRERDTASLAGGKLTGNRVTMGRSRPSVR